MKKILILAAVVTLFWAPVSAEKKSNSLVDQKVIVTINDCGIRSQSGYVLGVSNDTLHLGTRGKVRLDKIKTVDGQDIEFLYTGARYNPDSQTVSGISVAGESLVIPIADVRSVVLTYNVDGKLMPTTLDRDAVEKRLKRNVRYPEIVSRVPVDSIRTVQVWRRTDSGAVLLSALIGGAFGYAVSSATAEGPDPNEWFDFTPSRDTQIVLTTVGWVAIGGVIGYFIFKAKWTSVPLDRLKVKMAATPSGGVGLVCSVGF